MLREPVWFCILAFAFANAHLPADELSLDSLQSEQASTTSGLSLDDIGSAEAGAREQTISAYSPQRWDDNLRLATDLSVRPVYDGSTGESGSLIFAGIDLHKVFTDGNGDWGTLIAQNYLARNDNVPDGMFDDDHDFELLYRIFNFNYTRFGKGKTNFRVGHFEIPFGLQQTINTNGTLRDYTHIQNFGVKTDWGFTFNGVNDDIEYEIGLSRGSGNNWRRRNDPYIVAGRIGTSRDRPTVLGISAFHGKVLNRGVGLGTIKRTRVAGDITYSDEKLVWLGELSAGFEEDQQAYTALLEVDWTDPMETVLAYNQIVVRGFGDLTGWDNELRNSVGIRWTPDQYWALSGQASHFFDTLQGSDRGAVFELQMRYRF